MSGKMAIRGRVLMPNEIKEMGVVVIEDGIIRSIDDSSAYRGPIDIDAGQHLIAPGFIDIHIHGAKGHHLMTSNREGIIEVLRYHMKHGTTGLLATTTTAADETIQQALNRLKLVKEEQLKNRDTQLGASILGVHIEGPYFNPIRAGAQNRQHLRLPDLEEYKRWEAHGLIRMITIAPEMPGAEQLIRYIRNHSRVLISAGHTGATYEEIEESVAWGVSHCTHFTNAMSGFTEDEPGVFSPGTVGAGLNFDDMTVEVIADGIHVHPRVLELIYKVKGADRIAIITDAVPFCGMEEGIYKKDYGDRKEIVVKDGAVRMKEDGGLAGSALTMNRAAKQMASLGIPLEQVWKMTSEVPARLIGLGDRKGTIETGKDADLIIVNEDFEVQCSIIDGRVGYKGIKTAH